jgi:hypothetical protein
VVANFKRMIARTLPPLGAALCWCRTVYGCPSVVCGSGVVRTYRKPLSYDAHAGRFPAAIRLSYGLQWPLMPALWAVHVAGGSEVPAVGSNIVRAGPIRYRYRHRTCIIRQWLGCPEQVVVATGPQIPNPWQITSGEQCGNGGRH